MLNEFGIRILGALALALFVGSLVRLIVKPTPKLANRVRPYAAGATSFLGNTPDRSVVNQVQDTSLQPIHLLSRLSRPLIESLVKTLTKLFGGVFDDEALALRMRQSGVMADVPESERVHEFRVRQIGGALGFGVGFAFVTLVLPTGGPGFAVLGFALGVIVGLSRASAGIGSKIEDKRERMKVELYTINQLLAIYLRTSGSPILAAQRLTRRGRGAVIDDLNEALRLHARGMSAARAFNRIADTTPEPFAARTYKLLATGSERGADLASALLSLSHDVQDERRTSVKRSATKRQGAMLVPILVFLAPVMLVFIAAPLPSMLKGVGG